MSEERITLNNALNSFYNLKSKYEIKYNNFVKGLIQNTEMSNREKQKKLATFKKKCIVCDKEGGTVFTTSKKDLKAVCGNTASPCALDIHIQRAGYMNIETSIQEFKNDTEENKSKIIAEKMKILFGYKTEEETEVRFEELKEEFELDYSLFQEQLSKLNDILNNSMKKVELKRQHGEIIFIIDQMKIMMKEYNANPKDAIIKDIVDTYQSRLKPLLKKNMDTKYVVNNMLHDDEDDTYHLIQKKYTVMELYDEVEEPIIVSFKTKK